MGGRPSKGTKKDKRLKENPGTKTSKPKRPRRESRRRSASTLTVTGGPNI